MPDISEIFVAGGERAAVLSQCPLGGVYDDAVDRESAYELLRGKPAEAPAQRAGGAWSRPGGEKRRGGFRRDAAEERAPAKSSTRRSARQSTRAPKREKSAVEKVLLGDGRRQGLAEAMAKSAVRTVGRRIGSRLVRGIPGSLFKG